MPDLLVDPRVVEVDDRFHLEKFLVISFMHKKWVSVLMLLCFVFPAMARDLEQDEALRLRTQGVIVSLEDLLQLAFQSYPRARLLEAELEEEDGKYVYEVELLTEQGVVRELEFDARSGDLLTDEEDD